MVLEYEQKRSKEKQYWLAIHLYISLWIFNNYAFFKQSTDADAHMHIHTYEYTHVTLHLWAVPRDPVGRFSRLTKPL
jgi:hypothetical protein